MPNPIFLLFSSLTYHTVLFKQFSEKYGIINIITVLPPIWSSENGFTLLLGFTAQDCTKKWLAVPHYICKNVLVFSVFLFVCRWDEREEGTRVPAARWGVPGIPESQVTNMQKGKGDREQDIQMVTKWDGERWRFKTNTSPCFYAQCCEIQLSALTFVRLTDDSLDKRWFCPSSQPFFFPFIPVIALMAKVSVA